MYRTLLFAALVLAASLTTADAQVRFGLKAGLNTATMTFDGENELNAEVLGLDKLARLGFVGGAFAEVPLSPSFALRPEVLYAQKGFRYALDEEAFDDIDDVEIDGGLTFAASYVEVPVLALYRIPMQSGLEIGLFAGPYAAFKVSDELSMDLEGSIAGEPIDFDEEFGFEDEDVLTSTDFGAALGGQIGAGPFAVDLRYGLSLVDNADYGAAEVDDGERANVRHGVFSVTASWTFGR